jgi:MFS family permease
MSTVEGTKSQTPILFVLFLGVLMAALDIAILGPAIPAIRDAFSLGERQVSWVFSVWVLANLVSVPLMSKMADRYGRKVIYLFDIALFALGGVVVASASGFAVLLIGRGMQGAAASGIFPVAGAVIGDAFAPEKRGRAFGVLGSVFGVAFIIGPILAGMMLTIGWRWLYLGFFPIALFVIGIGWKILPGKYVRSEKPLDRVGLVSLAGILLAASYAISVLDTSQLGESLTSWRVINSILIIAILTPILIRSSRTAEDPVFRFELFQNRQVAIALLIAVGAGICEAAFIFFPTIAVLAYNVTMSEASFMLLPLMLAVAIGSPLAGRLLDKTGSKLIVLLSLTLLGLGMLGISTSPGSEPVFYLASVFIGLGLAGLLGSALSYILMHEAKKDERAVSQGVITLFISIGQLMSAAMVGAIAASSEFELDGYRTAFSVIVVITFILTGSAFFLKNKAEEKVTVFGSSQ